jgi:hypothetical protein
MCRDAGIGALNRFRDGSGDFLYSQRIPQNRPRLPLALFRRSRARTAITIAMASFRRFAGSGNHQSPVQIIGKSFPDCRWLRSLVSPADSSLLAMGLFVVLSTIRTAMGSFVARGPRPGDGFVRRVLRSET